MLTAAVVVRGDPTGFRRNRLLEELIVGLTS
jgi:hypothetical protein